MIEFVNYFIRGTIPRTWNYDSYFVAGKLEYGKDKRKSEKMKINR